MPETAAPQSDSDTDDLNASLVPVVLEAGWDPDAPLLPGVEESGFEGWGVPQEPLPEPGLPAEWGTPAGGGSSGDGGGFGGSFG